jgi:ribonuclease HIII
MKKIVLLLLFFNMFINAFGIKDLLHDITYPHIHIKVKKMNEAEYTDKTFIKDTTFAKVSFLKNGKDFILLLEPKIKNIMLKIQNEEYNQIIGTVLDANLSMHYKIYCKYKKNLTYFCKTTDSNNRLIDFEYFQIEKNKRNYLTIQNPFDKKVEIIGYF